MAVYLIHSTVPIHNPNGNLIRHYLGHCEDEPGALEKRLKDHNRGRNSKSTVREFKRLGGTLLLGNFFPFADHARERQMKDIGHSQRWCQICKAITTEADLNSYGKE